MTLTRKESAEKILSQPVVGTVGTGGDEREYVMGSPEDPWVIPGILSTRTSVLSKSEDWYLLNLVCWTTPPDTFLERHFQAIETIFVHSPLAVVLVFSPTLPEDFFSSYTSNGYNIHVVPISPTLLLERQWFLGPESEAWIKDWDRWADGPNFYSHITDYLRYFFLYRFGGTYQDMDAPWLRSPPDSSLQFIGADISTLASDVEWTLDENGTYLAPGVMRFRKGWTMFKELVERHFSGRTYRTDCFNCVGPRAVTAYVKEKRRELELNGMTILPKEVLYPYGWQQAYQLVEEWKGDGSALEELGRLEEYTWSPHLFGKMTSRLPIHDSSVLAALFDRFSLHLYPPSSPQSELRTSLSRTLELLVPSQYTYRSFLSISSTGEKDDSAVVRRGSLDGRFEGLNTLFVRHPRDSHVRHASIRTEATKGGVSLVGGSGAKRLGCSNERKCVSTGKKVEWTFGSVTIGEINGMLSGLVYSPP
ncbi:glycosyltransferase family 32 protein, partial [Atractiella rhizophila]